MEMKRTILSFSFVLAAMLAHAQLTLEGCQHSAQTNYPLVRQYGLIKRGSITWRMLEKAICHNSPFQEKQPTKVMLQSCLWTFRELI